MDIYVIISEEVQYDATIEESKSKICEFSFENIYITTKEARIKVWEDFLNNTIYTMEYFNNYCMVRECCKAVDSIQHMLDGFNEDLLNFEGRLDELKNQLQVYEKKQTLRMPADIMILLDNLMSYTEGLLFNIQGKKTTAVNRGEHLKDVRLCYNV